jgi:hypothetical protein
MTVTAGAFISMHELSAVVMYIGLSFMFLGIFWLFCSTKQTT